MCSRCESVCVCARRSVAAGTCSPQRNGLGRRVVRRLGRRRLHRRALRARRALGLPVSCRRSRHAAPAAAHDGGGCSAERSERRLVRRDSRAGRLLLRMDIIFSGSSYLPATVFIPRTSPLRLLPSYAFYRPVTTQRAVRNAPPSCHVSLRIAPPSSSTGISIFFVAILSLL